MADTQILGAISLVPRGEWQDNISYTKLSLVSKDGSSYIARTAVPAGTLVSNTNYWQVNSESGDVTTESMDAAIEEVVSDLRPSDSISNINWAQLDKNFTYTTGSFVYYSGEAITHPTNSGFMYSETIPVVVGDWWKIITRDPGNWSISARGIFLNSGGGFAGFIPVDSGLTSGGISTFRIPSGVVSMVVNRKIVLDNQTDTHILKLCDWQNIWNPSTYGHTKDYYISNTGVVTASAYKLAVTDAIPVTSGEIYRIANVHTGSGETFTTRGVFLAANGSVVKALPNNGNALPYEFNDVIVPPGAVSMRVNFYYEMQTRTDTTQSISINKAIQTTPRYADIWRLVGKKWAAYGDSTTYYANWIRMVENATGLRVWINGYSSACISQKTPDNTLCDDTRIATLMESDPDIVTIMGGLNTGQTPLGSASDFAVEMGSENKETFYGAYAYIVKKILTTKPTVKIIIMPTTMNNYNNANDPPNTVGLTSLNYAQACREVASYFGLSIADVRQNMQLNLYTNNLLLADNIHLSMRGAEVVASVVINSMLSDNTTGATSDSSMVQATLDSHAVQLSSFENNISTGVANALSNVDFSNGTTGWSAIYATIAASDGVITMTGTGAATTYGGILRQQLTGQIEEITDIWYLRAKVRTLHDDATSLRVGFRGDNGAGFYTILESPTRNEWYDISCYMIPPVSETTGNFYASAAGLYPTDTTSGKQTQVKEMFALNLTSLFGSGFEPSKAVMDNWIIQCGGSDTSFPTTGKLLRGSMLFSFDANRLLQANLKSFVNNGKFSSGISGWNVSAATTSVSNGVVTLTGSGTSYAPKLYQHSSIPCVSTDKIYICADVQSMDVYCPEIHMYVCGSTTSGTIDQYNHRVLMTYPVGSTVSDVVHGSAVLSVPEDAAGMVSTQIRSVYSGDAAASGKAIKISKVIAANLTQIFGAGMEPTAEQMDAIVRNFPDKFFADVVSVPDLQNALLRSHWESINVLTNKFNKLAREPLMVFTFDDGFATDNTIARPMLEAIDAKGTSFVIGSFVGTTGRMGWSTLKTMYDAGWDVQCHTWEHLSMGTLDETAIRYQLSQNDTAFAANNLPVPKYCAWPFGSYSVLSRHIGSEYRDGFIRVGLTSKFPYNNYDTEQLDILVRRAGDIQDETYAERMPAVKDAIDQAIRERQIFILMCHEQYVENPTETYRGKVEYLQEIVDYVAAKKIKCVTVSEMYEAIANYRS